MSVGRFATYFFALAACSTIAFATGLAGKVATAQAAVTGETSPAEAQEAFHAARLAHLHAVPVKTPKLARIARAD